MSDQNAADATCPNEDLDARDDTTETHEQIGIPLLLTQLGTHAASQFGARVAELGLTPPQVGMLRMIGTRPGLSQQALAEALGLLPSRLVTFVDELEASGLVTRSRGVRDRRVYELALTEQGRQTMSRVGEIAVAFESELTSVLTEQERERFGEYLRRIAAHSGLKPGVHPGYRRFR